MNSSTREKIIIDERVDTVCGKKIKYALLMCSEENREYKIRIEYCDEIIERTLSFYIDIAAKRYSLITKNTVTPCTLDDVLSDFEVFPSEC